jgi:FixJ family two-component response regulator
MHGTPTVFLVDDDAAVRDALTLFLDAAGLPVAGYPTAEAFFDIYKPEMPGCLVLDIRMPGMSGLEAQETLSIRKIGLPIIFISGHGDVPSSVKALKSGALDFLEKPFKNEQLLDRIREALAIDARRREEHVQKSAFRERCERLTPREAEVMKLMVVGKSNKQIAAKLGLSHRTVEIHRARVMEKMEVESLPDLVMKAVTFAHIGQTENPT